MQNLTGGKKACEIALSLLKPSGASITEQVMNCHVGKHFGLFPPF